MARVSTPSERTSKRWLPAGFVLLVLLLGVPLYLWLTHPKPPPPTYVPPPTTPRVARAVPAITFTDITKEAGIDFKHVNGAFGKKLLPETMGSGVAFLDYDGDGHPDLLFVNSCYWPGCEDGKLQPRALTLYRNDGKGKFTDVTEQAGLARMADGQTLFMYGMGVTVGDYNNDGWPDIFVTGVGGNRLFRNTEGEGGKRRFVDVTREAGVGGPGGWPKTRNAELLLAWKPPVNFSTSAAFLDFDGDGKLDLFVCNYVVWSPDFDVQQDFKLVGRRAYGPPRAFDGTHCFLYRNVDGKHFEDVSAKAGIQVSDREGFGETARWRALGKSLGVIACDIDDDGWPDIVVANDTARNFLFHNRGDGTFEEMGRIAGVDADSQPRGAMGIDWGEYRPNRSALVIGNFSDEPDTFLSLTSPKKLFFTDMAMAEGLAGPSRAYLKFGTLFLDYDLDGRLDLVTCNGHLDPEIHVQQGQTYAQPVQLFWNTGDLDGPCFEPVTSKSAGPDLFRPLVGRGCAYADIDGDGDLDLVLTENGGPARLLRNDGGSCNHWIRLTLIGDGVHSNTSAIGARVTLEAGGMVQRREVCSARGYLSQSELTLTFGLGQTTQIDKVTIRWPGKNGGTQVVTGLVVDKGHRIVQKVKE